MNTREALEKAIDENPLDPTPHLVIADWFDENGQPDEAAFRRAMGNWLQARSESGIRNVPLYKEGGWEPETLHPIHRWGSVGSGHGTKSDKWGIDIGISSSPETLQGITLPHGVDIRDVPLKRRGREDILREFGGILGTTDRSMLDDPVAASNPYIHQNRPPWMGSLYWKEYRHMEEAFRRAFMNNLQRQRSQKMARRVRARRYSRRK